ncbi:MAG: VWA domain-containing protein [Bacillota bacterium]|nr:VWA domain-containing protein [Bacillota bacterium]
MNAAAAVDTITSTAKVVIITMLDTEVYLGKISIFGTLLRNSGMEVSPKENEDAAKILSSMDLSDRTAVKTALRTVYAKSREEQMRFDQLFDAFFISEDAIRALDKKHQEEELKRRKNVEEASRQLQEQTPDIEYTEEEKEAYSKLSDEQKERLSNIKNKYSGEDRNPDLYTELIHTVFTKAIMEQQLKDDDVELGIEAVDPEIGLLFRDITKFQDNEIPKAVSYIQAISSRINGELTKKRNAIGKSSALDFKKTIRKGLSTGGSFYHLAYKTPKKRRKQLLILCDVSGSMIQFSEFALRLIQSINETSQNSRIVLFSEDSIDADPFHLQNMDLFREYVKESGIYGKGTNLGAALKRLNDERPAAISSSTALIILSDTKSVDMAGTLYELERARARAGKVYCLNPIPESQWKYSNSIMEFAQRCTMMSCSTLDALGNACKRLTSI